MQMNKVLDRHEVVREPFARGSQTSQLRELSTELLLQNQSEKLLATATRLYSLLSQISGIAANSDSPEDSVTTLLPSGKAISPKDAARCVLDVARTTKFLRGIHAAVVEARRRFPGEPIEILYAGCGPFATLALPLATQFSAQEVQFTLIDIHGRSLESARNLFHSFGLKGYVRDYVRSDAASYVHHSSPHIVVAETMQRALEQEPQVGITRNLVPQLRRGGFLIPEAITINAWLADLSKEYSVPPAEINESAASFERVETNRERINIGQILEFSAAHSFALPGETCVPVILDVPAVLPGNLNLILSTTVRVFTSVVLGEYESGLTCPVVMHDFNVKRRGKQIEFGYLLGNKPGFQWRWVDAVEGAPPGGGWLS